MDVTIVTRDTDFCGMIELWDIEYGTMKTGAPAKIYFPARWPGWETRTMGTVSAFKYEYDWTPRKGKCYRMWETKNYIWYQEVELEFGEEYFGD
ncbi:MAG: hypothetical protein KAS32_10565 [Candidatus Peribacteraceae bacterium]|nr:hypothetical protein [Candidatus Peribacteraceae bacterium]